MRKWLKYMLALMVAAIFWNCKEDLASTSVPDNSPLSRTRYEALCEKNISPAESELCLPHQISYTSPSQVQTTARRVSNYNRTNIEYAKSGRIINTGLIYFIQRKSIIIHASFIEPAHKLLYLGRLII